MFYSVSVFFKSLRSDNEDSLWEEKIFIIDAIDEEDARKKAKKNAVNFEVSFLSNGVTISWEFYCIERVLLIEEEIADGVEVFSRFIKESEAESILTPFDD